MAGTGVGEMSGNASRGLGAGSWSWNRWLALVLATLIMRTAMAADELGDPYRCCGSNCLTLIARLHGIQATHQSIKTLLRPRPNGDCSVADIERVSTSLGLRPISVRVEWDLLPEIPMPCIIQVS